MGSGSGGGVAAFLQGAADGMMEQVNSALPIAGPVFAVIAGIFMGYKIFKKLTGAKTG